MALAGVQLALVLLAHGGNGDWDDYALLVLGPIVIGGILWVTRRRHDDEEDADEPQPAESDPASRD
jgi:hypothetical protein